MIGRLLLVICFLWFGVVNSTEIRGHTNTNTTQNDWVLYKQCDPRWGSKNLGTCTYTLCGAGCAVSSMAMLLTTKGIKNLNPDTMNTYLIANGGFTHGCDIVWSAADKFGVVKFVAWEVASEQEICAGLNAGHGIIGHVDNFHHFILLKRCLGGGVYEVLDPLYDRTTYKHSELGEEIVYH
eukprot:TRINITY_DN89_c0_g2_i1.p1 TRINITY_DN89_c0_g2~~TRINITY_DN89_c0_g2_i1.p1  ORF type:complete len:181 (+),score=10.59 TRINITY_DN89_c0_g2_i1:77-619(+)